MILKADELRIFADLLDGIEQRIGGKVRLSECSVGDRIAAVVWRSPSGARPRRGMAKAYHLDDREKTRESGDHWLGYEIELFCREVERATEKLEAIP